MIKIENVTKNYGSFRAVDNISLEIEEGEIFGFLGMNGAGKTTTLKMLVGILKASSGSIEIGGYNINDQPIEAKGITGYIPDRPYLYSKLTGREFLYFVADLYYVPTDIAEERIDRLLNEFGLYDWQDELVESYSHGMKQRLATSAALVHDPKVLIIDEPMVGLDPHGAKLFKDSLKRYASQGKTIMLSTHSLNVAEELSNRLAIIHEGNIIAVGTLADIRRKTGGHQMGLENLFLQLTSELTQ